jgi:hypothetical protein
VAPGWVGDWPGGPGVRAGTALSGVLAHPAAQAGALALFAGLIMYFTSSPGWI